MPFFDDSSSGQPLPTLNLPRVYVLTGGTTCSASESIINGLRGVNVEVIQIGSTTCGKPYGFYPQDNCSTTYFTIQTTGVNAMGFGDYGDGFSPNNVAGAGGVRLPGCSVRDDFTPAARRPRRGAVRGRARVPEVADLSRADRQQRSRIDEAARWRFPSQSGDGLVRKSPWLMNRSLEGA